MTFSSLIIILSVLGVVLALLLLSYKFFPENMMEKKTSPEVSENQINGVLSIEQISAIFGNVNSKENEFIDAIEQLIKHHGKIQAKLGDLPHPDFKRYHDLIVTLCKNPKVNKDAVLSLENKLRALNMKYAHEIEEAVRKGLAARF